LESIKELYATDVDFKDAYENCREGRTWNKYVLQDGLLYHQSTYPISLKRSRLILLSTSITPSLSNKLGAPTCTAQYIHEVTLPIVINIYEKILEYSALLHNLTSNK
jgi:hypothetical protein